MILRFASPIDTHRRRYLSSLAMVDTGLSVDFTCHGSPAGYGRRDRKRITKPIDRSARDVYYPSFLLSFLPFLFFNRSVYSLYGSQEGILLIEYSVYREARRNTLDRISDRSCSTSHAFATTNQIYLPLVCLLKFFRELTCSWLIDPIKVSRVRPTDVLFLYFSFSVLSLSLSYFSFFLHLLLRRIYTVMKTSRIIHATPCSVKYFATRKQRQICFLNAGQNIHIAEVSNETVRIRG